MIRRDASLQLVLDRYTLMEVFPKASEATFDISPMEACMGNANNTLDQHLLFPKKSKWLD